MFEEQNKGIRYLMKKNHLQHWRIAEVIGIASPTLTRWLRTPLSKDRKRKIEEAMRALVEDRAQYYSKCARAIKVE